MSLRNAKLPDYVDKYNFYCDEQQILTVCYEKFGEFWKLFLDLKLICPSIEKSQVDDFVKPEYDGEKNLAQYYGLHYIPVMDVSKLEKGKIYFSKIIVKDYPLAGQPENLSPHAFLVYDIKDDDCIVNDQFYDITEGIMSKEDFVNGVFAVSEVDYSKAQIQEVDIMDYVDNIFGECFYDSCPLEQFNFTYKYNSVKLFDMYRLISSYMKKRSVLIDGFNNGDRNLAICAEIYRRLCQDMVKIKNQTLKKHLKFGEVPKEALEDNMKMIYKAFKIEKNVCEEIIHLVKKEESLRDKLYKQLLEYMEEDTYDEDQSLYLVHDHLSIMYLINFYEEKNGLDETDFNEYSDCETYRDFIEIIYMKVLCM